MPMVSKKTISARIISLRFILTFSRYAIWRRNATDVSALPISRPFFARVSCERVFIRACARRQAGAYCCEIIGIVMRDSIYFVYSAEKCFHLARPAGGTRQNHRERETDCRRTNRDADERVARPQAFSATKALNSTMRLSKGNNSRLSVNNSFDSLHISFPVLHLRKCCPTLKHRLINFKNNTNMHV